MDQKNYNSIGDKIRINLDKIKENIVKTCNKVGRTCDGLKILAATKSQPYNCIDICVQYGIEDIGENRVQEAEIKFNLSKKKYNKHMIGHLQKNKVKKAVKIFDVIQSVDSVDLARKISSYSELEKTGRYKVFLQVNISSEDQKYGINYDRADELIEYVKNSSSLELQGLMGISKFNISEVEIGREFAKLRKLKEKYNLHDLSIGMSNDYKIAIEEGSTMIRLGSAIFGERY